uniref:Uncharacterized protein n=1 Tax=Rhizophora mucronata TaxID=61149 RepID=A0A2P2Q339_RHIMU
MKLFTGKYTIIEIWNCYNAHHFLDPVLFHQMLSSVKFCLKVLNLHQYMDKVIYCVMADANFMIGN